MVTISVPSGMSGSAAWRRRRGRCARGLRLGLWLRLGRRRGLSGLLGGRGRSVLERGGVLAIGQDHGDRRIHRDVRGALGHQDLAKRALVDRLHLHGGLVGFDFGDHVAGLDLVALVLDPLGEVALLHGGRERGHQHLDRHGESWP
jgi:hypothetical protein